MIIEENDLSRQKYRVLMFMVIPTNKNSIFKRTSGNETEQLGWLNSL